MLETEFSVPASENEVTKEWLQVVLATTFPDATFDTLESKRIGEAYGFASRIFRFQWQDNKASQSVVIKLWDTDSNAGIGEVQFYQTFKDVGTRTPLCFFSGVDEKKKKAVLVLEDLQDAAQGDVLVQLDLARAKGIAHSLAKLHATWLEHPKLAELTWVPDVSIWTRTNDWFQSRRALFLERFPNNLGGFARLLLDKIEFAPQIANERLKDAPKTLLHGDFHLDNIVFESQTEPVLLDWSRPVKGSPTLNLVPLLFFMTPLDKFDTVFDYYCDEFEEIAESSLNRTAFKKQLGGDFLRAFSLSTCGVARWQPQLKRGVQILNTSIKQNNEVVNFWFERDPELFSFL